MENLGTTQEKAARRPEINRVKQMIKADNLISRPYDPDFPPMDGKERAVVASFGLQGVETVDDLFNRTDAPNYDHKKAKEALNVLSTAVYEVMVDDGLEDQIVAGSFSTERYLPSEWVGQDKSNPEGSRFASMVVQNFIDKFGTEEKKAEVSGILEYLDFIKNSDYNKGDFLEEQANEAYANLKKIKPNVMNRDEMDAYVKAVDYVSWLKTQKVPDVVPPVVDKKKDKKDDLRLRGELEHMPESVEEQRELARKLLDILEFQHLDPWSIEGAPYRGYLEDMRQDENVDDMVKSEISARLRLQLISGVMTGAGGWLGERTPASISAMLGKADNEGGLFDVNDMKFLLKDREHGLPVAIAGAWDMFQKINIGGKSKKRENCGTYNDILVDIASADDAFRIRMGHVVEITDADGSKKKVPDEEYWKTFKKGGMVSATEEYRDKEGMWSDAYDNYFMDADLERKKIVRAFMAENILKESKKKDAENRDKVGYKEVNMTDYEANKGVELAWNLLIATGETSVFNTAFVGHNDLSELILTKFDTLDRMYKGKPIGAFTCMQRIVSLSPTWLRYMSDRTIFGELKADDILIDRMAEITKYSIDYWYSSMVTQKIAELKSVMRSEDASPKELLNPSTLKKIGEWVGKAAKFPSVILDEKGEAIAFPDGKKEKNKDGAEVYKTDKKTGVVLKDEFDKDNPKRPIKITGVGAAERGKRIRFLMVAGWAEQAISNVDLGWDSASWKAFKDILTREYDVTEEAEPGEEKKKTSFISKEDMDYIDKKIMHNVLGIYPTLRKLEKIREARKNGVPVILNANNHSFDV